MFLHAGRMTAETYPLQSGLHSLPFEIRAFTAVADDFQSPVGKISAPNSQQPIDTFIGIAQPTDIQHLFAFLQLEGRTFSKRIGQCPNLRISRGGPYNPLDPAAIFFA